MVPWNPTSRIPPHDIYSGAIPAIESEWPSNCLCLCQTCKVFGAAGLPRCAGFGVPRWFLGVSEKWWDAWCKSIFGAVTNDPEINIIFQIPAEKVIVYIHIPLWVSRPSVREDHGSMLIDPHVGCQSFKSQHDSFRVLRNLYNPYKWPYKWVNGVITLLIGIITPLMTGVWAHLVYTMQSRPLNSHLLEMFKGNDIHS